MMLSPLVSPTMILFKLHKTCVILLCMSMAVFSSSAFFENFLIKFPQKYFFAKLLRLRQYLILSE